MARSSLVPLLGLVALFGLACSDAEAPAGDGGPIEHPVVDAGPDLSKLNQPCPDARCDSDALVCVDHDDNLDTTGDRTCRLKCDPGAASDPCGQGMRCLGLQEDLAACQPVGARNEPCPCDDGLRCVDPDPDAPGPNLCKVACDPDGDGSECEEGERCAPFEVGGGGACVE